LYVICLDNFSNSSPEAVKRVEKIAGKRVTLVTATSAIAKYWARVPPPDRRGGALRAR